MSKSQNEGPELTLKSNRPPPPHHETISVAKVTLEPTMSKQEVVILKQECGYSVLKRIFILGRIEYRILFVC